MIAVVSHDAGGAEILSSYIRQQSLDCVCVLQGPARAIFRRKIGEVATSTLTEAVDGASSVLCGSGWQTDLEVEAIRLARMKGKPSVVFLDHWTNYQERFVRGGRVDLPDEIWVGDDEAWALATRMFPALKILLVDNPYMRDLRQQWQDIVSRAGVERGRSVLYVCEPMRDHSLLQYGHDRHWGYVEEDALRYCLRNIGALHASFDSIMIRPHPAEPRDKYQWAIQEFNLPLVMGGSRELLDEMTECHTVVGCESMAMVVGLLAGKRVVSCVPPGGKPCALPHARIEHLQALV